MKKLLRVLPLVAVMALTAVIPASAQVVEEDGAGAEAGANLPMVIAVNRLELTVEQMEEIRSLLTGLLETRTTREASIAAFEQEMIAFQGTAEELDALLEAHRTEAMAFAEAQREEFTGVIDQIKSILTIKQGEALHGVLGNVLGVRAASGAGMEMQPGALGRSRGMGMSAGGRMGHWMSQDPISDRGIEVPEDRETLRERMEERFGDQAGTMLERFEERMAEFPDVAERLGRLRMEMSDRPAQAMERLGVCGVGEISVRRNALPGAAGQQRMFGVRQGGGMEILEQLVEVLELKLQAIE